MYSYIIFVTIKNCIPIVDNVNIFNYRTIFEPPQTIFMKIYLMSIIFDRTFKTQLRIAHRNAQLCMSVYTCSVYIYIIIYIAKDLHETQI